VKLKKSVYGCVTATNTYGISNIERDPQADLSIFDEECFKFYAIKYCEVFGPEPLLALISSELLE
jgi:hypothetical protein